MAFPYQKVKSIIKIESTFNHEDLCDESEQWAFFPDEQRAKDFGERLFSKEVRSKSWLQWPLSKCLITATEFSFPSSSGVNTTGKSISAYSWLLKQGTSSYSSS